MTRAPILHLGASQTLDSVVLEQLRGLRECGWDIVVACPNDAWTARIVRSGFEIAPVRMGRRPSPTGLLAGALDIERVLRRRRPALVHTHNAHHGVAGRLLARAHGIPSVHTWRYSPLDASRHPTVRALYGVAEALAARAGDAVLFQNPDDLQEAVASGIVPPGRAHMASNGIRVEAYRKRPGRRERTRKALGLAPDTPVVLCVARLEERKRQADVIAAVAAARSRLGHLELLLVGTGPDEPNLRAVARKAGVEALVHFLGLRDDVPALLDASDVLALASRREGVPRSVMEAMAAGIPVVATDVVGTRQVAHDGETALLVPLGAVDQLADALVRVLADRCLAARLTTAAAALIERDWREEQVVARVDALYRRLLAAGPGRR